MKCDWLLLSKLRVLWLLQSCGLQSTQRSATTRGYGTISVGFGRMLRAKFLQQFTAHDLCSRRPQCGIERNQPIHKFILGKKKSLPGNIVKILHKFGFFNSIIIIKKCDYLLICKFVFLRAYFKITWFHCFVSNCKNCKYAKYFTVHNMYS